MRSDISKDPVQVLKQFLCCLFSIRFTLKVMHPIAFFNVKNFKTNVDSQKTKFVTKPFVYI